MVIGFSYHRYNPVSWLIEQVTAAPFSHTWIGYRDEVLGQNMVLEATFPRLTVVPRAIFDLTNVTVCTLDPPVDVRPGVQALAHYLGSAYDDAGLLGMLWVVMERYLRHATQNPFRSPQKMFCSEAVTRALAWSGFAWAMKVDPETVTAQDVYRAIVEAS